MNKYVLKPVLAEQFEGYEYQLIKFCIKQRKDDQDFFEIIVNGKVRLVKINDFVLMNEDHEIIDILDENAFTSKYQLDIEDYG